MRTNRSVTVAWVSLGCPKNLVDSERMLGLLAQAGCVVAAPMDNADVIVINTCGFLASARDESLSVIREALQHKQQGRARRVVVAGCLPSRDRETLPRTLVDVDAFVGVNDRNEIIRAVLDEKPCYHVTPEAVAFTSESQGDTGRFRLTPPHTAYLRIAEGCDQKCSFCTIPAIRGPFRSKPHEMILAEARELIASGAVELNVIAQDTTGYGTDLTPAMSLAKLLRALDTLDGVEWIRLLYTYPLKFTDELIDTIALAERIVPYVDMPLQHISDKILRRMNRRVSRSEIETLLQKLRDRIDGLAIRTSFIVGSPGEGQGEFDELLKFVEDLRFDAVGVFEFSPEEGTAAAKMSDQVPADVAADRASQLMALQHEIALQDNTSLVGQDIRVLIDGVDSSNRCVGRYYGQAPDIDGLCILTEPQEAGEFVDARIVDADAYDLIVCPCDELNP